MHRNRNLRRIVGACWLGACFVMGSAAAIDVAGTCPADPPPDLRALAQGFAPEPGDIVVESASTGPEDPAQETARRRDEEQRFQLLLARRSGLAATAAIRADLDAARKAQLARADGIPLKVGESVQLGIASDFSSVAWVADGAQRAVGAGQAVMAADGSITWEVSLASAGAKALRLEFTGFDLAEGVELHVYNESGQVRGPYTGGGPDGSGGFWSGSVFGERASVQVHARDAAAFAASAFTLQSLMHMGARFHVADAIAERYARGPRQPEGGSFCGVTVPDCTINGVCAIATNPGLAAASNAVAQISFVEGGSGYICTGSLINPSGSVRTPYFLTANHCFDTQASASSLEAHFRFRTTACDTSCALESVVETSGSTLLATGALPTRGDYTLVRLNSVPGGLTLLGWSAGHPSEGGYLIHLGHPGGAPLAYSVRRIRHANTTMAVCSDLPRPTFLYSGLATAPSDAQGGTAGGSSGGPALLLAAGGGSSYIVGQLFGACYFDAEAPCDANEESTVDGAMEHTFPYLRVYLYNRIFSNGFD